MIPDLTGSMYPPVVPLPLWACIDWPKSTGQNQLASIKARRPTIGAKQTWAGDTSRTTHGTDVLFQEANSR